MYDKKIYDTERILPDDYPVHYGYMYVVDGKVCSAPDSMTIKDLKIRLKASEIRNCDIAKRNLW